MKIYLLVLVLGLTKAVAAVAQSDYYRHFIFDNSLTEDAYYYSTGAASGESELKLDNYRLPVDNRHFFSPPNSLRCTWTSRSRGDWSIGIELKEWRNRNLPLTGDTLYFWVSSPHELEADQLPLLTVEDQEGTRSRALNWESRYKSAPDKKGWRQIRIALDAFRATGGRRQLRPHRLQKIMFSQSAADGNRHTIFIDDIRVASGTVTDKKSPEVPSEIEAAGYDSHINLSWQPVSDRDLLYYVIHRSDDGINFRPVGIQRPGVQRYTDFLGKQGRKGVYKISAVDNHYNESNVSASASASTRTMSNEELLTMVQEASFRYYWEGAHPEAGMALENIPGNRNLIALGASGFGIMAIVTGIERGFISRKQGIKRMQKILRFLQKADRFKGVWPHFLDGKTGEVIPLFGKFDNGGDLVETSFLIQGLLAARQYFDRDSPEEKKIYRDITQLWESVEWSWYQKNRTGEFLYWHWSPDWKWHINHKLIGWNETMITYLLAIASPTHSVPAWLYYSGWASQSKEAVLYRRNWGKTKAGDHYANGNSYYDISLDVGVGSGGPLFFTHYSFMGFDPRGKRDKYTNYFKNNRAIARINQAYCIDNPLDYKGYGASGWGLTASDGPGGYQAHEPSMHRDSGTLTPTGAISSFPYTPEASMKALKYFYREHGDKLWGIYGFRDAFNLTEGWVASIYMGLNQAPMTVMIENYRSGLIWDLFMSNPEMKPMLKSIGFKVESSDAKP